MELASLIDAALRSRAYPEPVGKVEVPPDAHLRRLPGRKACLQGQEARLLGFLDFSTLDRRRFYCDEEVRLNRRLAPTLTSPWSRWPCPARGTANIKPKTASKARTQGASSYIFNS